jgi:hypothetical protein
MASVSHEAAHDDEEPRPWLALLREGRPHRRIEARAALAWIFEQCGMLAQATDLLVANVQAGFLNVEVFRRLARLYRALGDEPSAALADAEADKYARPAIVVASSAQRELQVPEDWRREGGYAPERPAEVRRVPATGAILAHRRPPLTGSL